MAALAQDIKRLAHCLDPQVATLRMKLQSNVLDKSCTACACESED
jgi:hypothetical protein